MSKHQVTWWSLHHRVVKSQLHVLGLCCMGRCNLPYASLTFNGLDMNVSLVHKLQAWRSNHYKTATASNILMHGHNPAPQWGVGVGSGILPAFALAVSSPHSHPTRRARTH